MPFVSCNREVKDKRRNTGLLGCSITYHAKLLNHFWTGNQSIHGYSWIVYFESGYRISADATFPSFLLFEILTRCSFYHHTSSINRGAYIWSSVKTWERNADWWSITYVCWDFCLSKKPATQKTTIRCISEALFTSHEIHEKFVFVISRETKLHNKPSSEYFAPLCLQS